MKQLLTIFFCCVLFALSHGQSSNSNVKRLDSLFSELRKDQHDTTLAKLYYRIGFYYEHNNFIDSGFIYYNKALALAQRIDFAPVCIKANKEFAFFHYDNGKLDSASKYFNRALSYMHSDNPDYHEVYTGLGTVYFYKGDFIKSYEFYLKSLKLAEGTGKMKLIARAYGNVGVALKEQKKHDDALIFFTKSLDIAKKNDLKSQTYVALTNIGNIYSDKHERSRSQYDLKNALDNYLAAKEIVIGMVNNDKDRSNAVTLLGNIGNTYADMRDYDKALSAFKEALDLMGDKVFLGSVSLIYNNLATVYIDMQKTKEAEKYLKLSMEAAKENESPSDIMDNYKCYASLYEIKGDWKNAYLYHYRYKKLSDSLFSTENAEKRKEIELNAEYETKEATAKLEHEKKDAIDKEEKRRQQILRNALIVGFILMILVAFLIFRSYRIKKKSNEIITQQKLEVEKQKDLVDEKQKEILDSIHYAKRIQQSLLPTNKYIDRNLSKLKDKENFNQ